MKSSIIAAAAAIGSASAYSCTNLTIPVDLSARNGVFNVTAPQNNIEVTNFILDLLQQGQNYTAKTLQEYATVKGRYNLAATYCVPDQKKARRHGWGKSDRWGGDGYGGGSYGGAFNGSAAPKTVQVLTHGIGFDRSYWDVPFNGYNYSYTKVAADTYGYATLSYDRLGIGMSSHGDPVQEIQAWLEVDALRAITEGVRQGTIKGVPKFDKVLHVGHSFGSQHTYSLTAMYPGISDGIALTGFSQNGSFIPYFGFGGNFIDVKQNPTLAPKYDHGYFAAGNPSGVQTNFFSPGMFDPNILTFAATTGQPVSAGELLTIAGQTRTPNTYKGPVLIITGERDIPYCGGSCYNGAPAGSSIPAMSQANWPSTTIQTKIVGGAGHGLNLEYSHPITYKSINDFFASKVPAN